MRDRVASSFPRRLNLPSVPTGYPFAAGWTVSEHSVRASSRTRTVGLPPSAREACALATMPPLALKNNSRLRISKI